MSALENRSSLQLGVVIAVAIIVLLAVLIHFSHRNRALPAQQESVAASPAEPPQDVAVQQLSEGRILADCHPHLTGNSSVPNFDVSERPNPAAATLKVRFWVNGDGFVTQAIVTGANVVSADDREEALHYVKGLTFSVPNTVECRARQIELIGNFLESRGSTGEWTTLFAVHPRFTFDGNHVQQNR
jgi:hypothetical protein